MAADSRNGALVVVALAMALLVSGCQLPATRGPISSLAGSDFGPMLSAGVAAADITPPLGLALFGHGPEGRVAAGVLLRLRCRAFVLSQGSEAVALVPCDLAAPSLELHRAIAKRVRERGLPLGVDRIVLMASHTHAGPAHYFGTTNYADKLSARLPGFDQQVVDWLAERVATAIEQAWAQRVPACAGWVSDEIRGLTRNRSFAAFAANPVLPPGLEAAIDHDADTAPRWSPVELAVDPVLSLLRIDDCSDLAQPTPLGALAVFGVHPTAVPNTNDLYHGDLLGYAVRAAEAKLATFCVGEGASRRCPLVGVANGIEGDVSANWGHQAPREARRLGRALAEHIVRLHRQAAPRRVEGAITRWTGALSRHFPIRSAYRELRLPGAAAQDDTVFYRQLCQGPDHADLCFEPAAPRAVLCREGAIGTSAAGGAEDGPTRLRALPQMHEGQRAPHPQDNPCHAEKMRLMPPFSAPDEDRRDDPIDESDHAFPTLAPISLLQLGDRLLATLPAEPTTVVGVRLRQRLEAFLASRVSGRRPLRVVVVGLTNNWLQYVSTAAEYAEQHYEGASTLYGPHSERFFSNQMVCLANWLYGDPARDEECRMGQRQHVGLSYTAVVPAPRHARLAAPPDELPEVVELEDPQPHHERIDGLDSWLVSWRGVPASFMQTPRSIRVRLVSTVTGEVFDDTEGSSIELRHQAASWTARWFPELEPGHPSCNRRVHFEIDTAVHLRSKSFLVLCRRAGGGAAPEVSP